MIHFYCIALLVLCGQVELFKLGLLSAPPTDQAEYYPSRQQQQYGYQHQVYAGRPQQLPYQPYQPPALAYVIVRPIAPSYPYYDSSVRYWSPLHQQAAPEYASGVKGGERLQAPLELPTKGGSRPEFIRQEPLEDPAALQRQPEPANLPPPPPPQQSEQIYDLGLGKLLKIKNSIDKFAASAKSKLALGGVSSYYVSGEEFVTPVAPAQPLRQEQLQTSDIQLTKLEQQRLEDAGQVKLDSQQPLEETRQTKLEESRATKLEDTRQTKLEDIRQTKLEDTRQIKLEEAPASQVKLEDTRQEKLVEQEPRREKETKGLEQLPQQQEQYAEKGLQHHQQQQFQQQREELEGLKAEAREQPRFNGQQPTSYLASQADSDGFGKRNSAL